MPSAAAVESPTGESTTAMESATAAGKTAAPKTAPGAKARATSDIVGVPDESGGVVSSCERRVVARPEVVIITPTIPEAVAEEGRSKSQPGRIEAPAERV